jgi:hypothetical protein
MQYHTSVLIDSTTTLNFLSQDFLTRNNILGKCIRVDQKSLFELQTSRGFSRLKLFHLALFTWSEKVHWSQFSSLTTS